MASRDSVQLFSPGIDRLHEAHSKDSELLSQQCVKDSVVTACWSGEVYFSLTRLLFFLAVSKILSLFCFNFIFSLIWVNVLPEYMQWMYMCRVLRRQKKTLAYLKTGVTDGSEAQCGCWESNQGPLEEHPVLQTTELSLQPLRVESGAIYLYTTRE